MQTHENWNCPLTRLFDHLSGKWKIQILWKISQSGQARFNQLLRDIDGITKTRLAKSLEELMADDLIIKKDFKTMPLHIEYSLTNKGKKVVQLLTNLNSYDIF